MFQGIYNTPYLVFSFLKSGVTQVWVEKLIKIYIAGLPAYTTIIIYITEVDFYRFSHLVFGTSYGPKQKKWGIINWTKHYHYITEI